MFLAAARETLPLPLAIPQFSITPTEKCIGYGGIIDKRLRQA
jgi:hypothetical protein